MSVKRWVLPELDKEGAAQLAEDCGLHPFLALMLTLRGISTPEEAGDFLLGDELQDDPFGFADMDLAVERIQRAMENGEHIVVFGDYDADGVTSTALLYTYLKEKNAHVSYYVPKREGEGYGLHTDTVDVLAEQGAQLIVTVDNGIAAAEPIAYAHQRGIDVVVTDHHQPQDILPPAVAVVDPHRADCGSLCKDYAGVGVAFKLVCALEGDADAVLDKYGDLVALGTLADVMLLRGENRVLVRAGLQVLNRGQRIGLVKLREAAGAAGKEQTSTSVVFTLAPRINAAGRMGEPEQAARLLMTEDPAEAETLAAAIHQCNLERQKVESEIFTEVLQKIEDNPAWMAQRVLVLAGENWHPGVIGILAARVVERFGKPCILLSVSDGIAKGSGRSIKGFSLFAALQACAEGLLHYGGHELAAGVGLEAEKIGEFRQRINAYAAENFPVMPVPELAIDCKLRPSQIDVEKLNLLAALEPFGAGNPSPVFGLFGMRLDNITPIGNGKHLRLSLSRDDCRLSALRFQVSEKEFPIPCGAVLNLAVTLDKSEYRGTISPSIVIKDIRYADTRQEELLEAGQQYDQVIRQEWTDGCEGWTPDREQMKKIYNFLRKFPGWTGTLEQLYHNVEDPTLGYVQLRLGLEILRQAGLIALNDTGERLRVVLQPVTGKANLNDTPIMRFLLHNHPHEDGCHSHEDG